MGVRAVSRVFISVRRRLRKFSLYEASIFTLLAIGAIASLLPFIWMIGFSFGRSQEFLQLPPPIIPSELRFGNYQQVFDYIPFTSFLWNSLFVTVIVVGGQIITCSMAAYAFARLQFPGKGLLFIVLIASLMVPSQATIIPLFLMMKPLGLIDSGWALIVPSLVSVFGVFLLRQFMLSIPKEIEESAVIDGAGHWRIYRSIMLPMTGPALAALTILSFNATWNSFLWPLIVINTPPNMTIPVGLAFLNGQNASTGVPTAVIMAGTTMSVIPALLVFLLLQRRLISGIVVGTTAG